MGFSKEEDIFPFMEFIKEIYEHVSMQFVDSWDNRKVSINGNYIQIMKELIVNMGGLSLKERVGVNKLEFWMRRTRRNSSTIRRK